MSKIKNFFSKIFPSKETRRQYRPYILLGTVVFIIGLIWNFPKDRLYDMVIAKIQEQTGVNIQMDSMGYAFPIGIKAKKLKITSIPVPALAESGIELDQFAFTSDPISLITLALKQKGKVRFKGQKGKMKFNIQSKIADPSVHISGTASGLAIAHDVDTPMGVLGLDGLMSANLDIVANQAALQKGDYSSLQGPIKATIKKALIKPPLMSQIKFDQISLDTNTKSSKMIVKALKMDGPVLGGIISGKIDLRPVIERSIADLDGKIQMGKEGESLKQMLSMARLKIDASGKASFKMKGPFNNLDVKSY